MGEQIFENQIKLLESQIMDYQNEINAIIKERDEYFHLMQSLAGLLIKQNNDNTHTKTSIVAGDTELDLNETLEDIKIEIANLYRITESTQQDVQGIFKYLMGLMGLKSKIGGSSNDSDFEGDISELRQLVTVGLRPSEKNSASPISNVANLPNHNPLTHKNQARVGNFIKNMDRQSIFGSGVTLYSNASDQHTNIDNQTLRFSSHYVANSAPKKRETQETVNIKEGNPEPMTEDIYDDASSEKKKGGFYSLFKR